LEVGGRRYLAAWSLFGVSHDRHRVAPCRWTLIDEVAKGNRIQLWITGIFHTQVLSDWCQQLE
jgi:hypothetical protein